MSASAEIIIESEPNALLIPVRASFMHKGKPAVYVQKGEQFVNRDRSKSASATKRTWWC